MSIGLVGHTGFVGGHLKMQCDNITHLFNSLNIETIEGLSFDTLYLACCPAEKWKANKYPDKDTNNLIKLKGHLSKCLAKKVILISTIDVYSCNKQNEDNTPETCHTYGKNRYDFEQYISKTFSNVQIVRLPALFGFNLKKNYIYDLLHENMVENIKAKSSFQWFDMADLYHYINVYHDKKIVNLFPEPITTSEIIDIGIKSGVIHPSCKDKVSYEKGLFYCNYTKYSKTNFIYGKDDVIRKLIRFFKLEKVGRKLAISNIAWNDEKIEKLFYNYNIKHIEVAPTKIWGTWDNVDAKINPYLSGLTPVSFQALCYGCKDMDLFKSNETKENFISHMKRVIMLTTNFSSPRPPALVFGSPKLRNTYGKSKKECDDIFVNIFTLLSEFAKECSCVICLESNPKQYKCEYLYNIHECAKMVRKINSEAFKLHIDVACMTLDGVIGENMYNCILDNKDIIYHCHISEPFLNGFELPLSDHKTFAKSIKELDNIYYSIEMKNGDTGTNYDRIEEALKFIIKTYF